MTEGSSTTVAKMQAEFYIEYSWGIWNCAHCALPFSLNVNKWMINGHLFFKENEYVDFQEHEVCCLKFKILTFSSIFDFFWATPNSKWTQWKNICSLVYCVPQIIIGMQHHSLLQLHISTSPPSKEKPVLTFLSISKHQPLMECFWRIWGIRTSSNWNWNVSIFCPSSNERFKQWESQCWTFHHSTEKSLLSAAEATLPLPVQFVSFTGFFFHFFNPV